MIVLLVIWNVMSGDANVFLKMLNLNEKKERDVLWLADGI